MKIPKHDCDYTENPMAGYCSFCDEVGLAIIEAETSGWNEAIEKAEICIKTYFSFVFVDGLITKIIKQLHTLKKLEGK